MALVENQVADAAERLDLPEVGRVSERRMTNQAVHDEPSGVVESLGNGLEEATRRWIR